MDTANDSQCGVCVSVCVCVCVCEKAVVSFPDRIFRARW